MKRLGKLFVLAGPSGVGKSTIRSKLISELGLVYSISATTRKPRPDEQNGVDYQFISPEEFQRMADSNEFLEWANVFGRGYGTPKTPFLKHINSGRDVLLEIDVQGVKQVRQQQKSLGAEVYYIFLLPPSLRELKERQQNRGTDSAQEIEKRYQEALQEISHAHEFDLIVINKNVDDAVEVITRFVRAAQNL